MKSRVFVCVLSCVMFALVLGLPARQTSASQAGLVGSQSVAVLRFTFGADSNRLDQRSLEVSNALVTLLGIGLSQQGVSTVERNEDVLGALDEQFKELRSGFIDPQSAPEIGKRLGAKWLLTGFVETLDCDEAGGYVLIRPKLTNAQDLTSVDLKEAIIAKVSESDEKRSKMKRSTISLEEVLGKAAGKLAPRLGALGSMRKLLDGGGADAKEIKRSPVYQTIMRAAYALGKRIADNAAALLVNGEIAAAPDKDNIVCRLGLSAGLTPGRPCYIYKRLPIDEEFFREEHFYLAEVDQVQATFSLLKLKGPKDPGAMLPPVMGKDRWFARPRPMDQMEWERRLLAEREAAQGK